MTPHQETPDFASWQHDTLVKFATEVFIRLQNEQDANKQIRLDFKDAMKLARKQILKDNAA